MNRLLKFFLPRIVPVVLKFYLLFMAVLLMMKVLNFEADDTMIGMVLWIIFPVVIYFSRHLNLSSNLHWVLLTPVKNKDIVKVNAIVNVLKFLLVFALAFISSFFQFGGGDLSNLRKIDFSKLISKLFSDLSGSDISSIVMGLTIIAAGLFMLMPDPGNSIRERQDHRVANDIFRDKKQLLKRFGVAAAFFALFMVLKALRPVLPNFILLNGAIALAVTIAVFLTLKALRAYFSYKKLAAFGSGFFLVLLVLVFSYSKQNLSAPHTKFATKLEELNFLGFYAGEQRQETINQMLSADEKLKFLNKNDLSDLFQEGSVENDFKVVTSSWLTQCELRGDFSCRLYSYLQDLSGDSGGAKSSLRKACLQDLQACYELLFHPKADQADKALAEAQFKVCGEENKAQAKLCKRYKLYEKRKGRKSSPSV